MRQFSRHDSRSAGSLAVAWMRSAHSRMGAMSGWNSAYSSTTESRGSCRWLACDTCRNRVRSRFMWFCGLRHASALRRAERTSGAMKGRCVKMGSMR